jgi:hypothetical protein
VSPKLEEILVGCILGDLNIRIQSVNASLRFTQGLVHEKYLLHLYNLFKTYCSGEPKTYDAPVDKRTGKSYSCISFDSYSLPCFNELHELFYVDGKKVVPSNIAELLTALGLAYWISDDGGFDKSNNRVTLNTQSFTLAEVELLISVLSDKFGLNCTINKNRKGFVIRIPSKSLPRLQALLQDIMPGMMVHKIGL